MELGLDGGGFAENDEDGGEDKPMRLMEEKVSISSLPKDMTLRRLLDVDGERIVALDSLVAFEQL